MLRSIEGGGEGDRVRRHTSARVNQRIERRMHRQVQRTVQRGIEAVQRRLHELEHEWDIERILEINASAFALTGLVAGLVKSPKYLLIPGLVLPFLLLHGLQGWCPPVPLLRRLGVRTQQEIDYEKYLLWEAIAGEPV